MHVLLTQLQVHGVRLEPQPWCRSAAAAAVAARLTAAAPHRTLSLLPGSGCHPMMLAMRTLAVCRSAAARQLPRTLSGARALRTLCAAAPLPGRRPAQPAQPRGVSSGRALPQAAAVEAPTASSPAAASTSGPANGAPTFQEAISRLQEYWASVGCALWLPHNTEVRVCAGRLGMAGQLPAAAAVVTFVPPACCLSQLPPLGAFGLTSRMVIGIYM